MKEIVLDTETTGLSVKDGHRLVEIGCIELDDLVPTGKKFHCYLNPERKVSENALKVHGYTDQFLSKQKKFIEIVDDFLEFIKEKKDLERIILCDVPTVIYPDLEKTFLNLVHASGHPNIKLEKKVDFNKLYNERFN